MAVDTQAKRVSAVCTRRLPWFRRFWPVTDGTVSESDRRHMGFSYSGIEAYDPTLPVADVIAVIDRTAEVSATILR